jgi:two-component system, LuxR family, response regulator FixJ
MSAQATNVFVVSGDERARMLVCTLAVQPLQRPCKEFNTGCKFLETYRANWPGCLVLDMTLPDLDGLALQQELITRGATLPIIFIADGCAVSTAVEAMRRGAFNLLQKPLAPSDVAANIERALDLDHHKRLTAARVNALRERLSSLTPREREVLDRVSRGEPNKVIAMSLQVSERSIEFHRSRGMEKMGASSLAQLMRILMNLEEAGEGHKRGPSPQM